MESVEKEAFCSRSRAIRAAMNGIVAPTSGPASRGSRGIQHRFLWVRPQSSLRRIPKVTPKETLKVTPKVIFEMTLEVTKT